MSYLLNNQQKMNDVVFEHRNKSYGAYAIRSEYGSTLFKSLLLMGLISAAFASLAFYLSKKKQDHTLPLTEQARINERIYSIPLDLKPKEHAAGPENKKPLRQEPGKAATGLSTSVKDSAAVETHSQILNEQPVQQVSTIAGTGDVSQGAGSGDTGSSGNTPAAGNGTASVQEIFEVDHQPEFEGGLAALYRFLSEHLKYPAAAVEAGKEGTLHVRFVVDEKGRVGNLVLLNKLGFGCDEEAKRVVSLIPDFKTPAKVGKSSVKVYYQIPINFKLR